MKRLFFILSFLAVCSVAAAQSVLISKTDKALPVQLYRYVYGELEALSCKSGLSEVLVEDLEKGGVYVVYSGFLKRTFIADHKLKIEISKDAIDFLDAKGINAALQDWFTVSDDLRTTSTENYRSPAGLDSTAFFSLYRELPSKREALLKKYRRKLSSSEFDILKVVSFFDQEAFLYSYITSPRTRYHFRNMPGWIKDKIKETRYTSSSFVEYYSDASIHLQHFTNAYGMCGFPVSGLKNVFADKNTGALYALACIKSAKTYSQFTIIHKMWKDYFVLPLLQERLAKHETYLKKLAKGAPGLDFSLYDFKGNLVKFSDFKGKVVLVDFWATWCGPCKRELPHLKKLKAELSNEDVAVIGISVDDAEQKEYWKRMAAGIGGYQLIDSDHVASRYYKCAAVPLFLLFDKEGKIVSLNAPRPSSPELIRLIRSLL